jgi:hypothetical protein
MKLREVEFAINSVLKNYNLNDTTVEEVLELVKNQREY